MSTPQSVAVQILGQEYRIRSDGDDGAVQRVAAYVDDIMETIRERSGTVDSRKIAVLAALNIANELLTIKDGGAVDDPSRVHELVSFVESILGDSSELV